MLSADQLPLPFPALLRRLLLVLVLILVLLLLLLLLANHKAWVKVSSKAGAVAEFGNRQ
jgi:hypothetical protein